MNEDNGAVFSVGSGYPVALPEKKSPLKKILIIAGIVVILVAAGFVAWNIVQNVRGIDKKDAAAALEDSVELVTLLDDRVAMIRGGEIVVLDVFAEEAQEIVAGWMDGLGELCAALCDATLIRGASGDENEQFVVVRTGIRERNEIYRKYFGENFVAFYEAFAESFRNVGRGTYKRTDAISRLMNSGNLATAELAKSFDDYLSGVATATMEFNTIGCSSDMSRTGCSELRATLGEHEAYIRNRDLTRKLFFGGDGTETALTDNFLRVKMSLLAQSLRLGSE